MITFSNLHAVNLYLNSALDWGNFTVKFDNIHADHDFGYGKEGSVVVYGEAEFCVNPCTGDPAENNTNCNNCDPSSTLLLEFDRLSFVLTRFFSMLLKLLYSLYFQFEECHV